jgi:CBS domain containing-hemolysin-like protein
LIALALIGLALLVSAVFSGAETVVLSAQRPRLAGAAQKARGRGWAARLAEDPARVLATVLVANSLANVFAASLATLWVARRFDEAAVWIAVVVVAVLALLVGEILPKSLARAHADRLGERVVPIVAAAYWVLRPWVVLVRRTAGALLRLLGQGKGPLPFGLTRQDLQVLLSESEELGRLSPVQERILRRVFDFAETPVGALMVPRTRMAAVPLGTPAGEALRLMAESRHARLPVYREELDQVIGVVHRHDLLRAPNRLLPVDGMARPVYLVPDSKDCGALLRELQARRQQMAIVLDEYGGTAGLVTQEDLIEELVGEIREEHDPDSVVRRLDAFTVAVPAGMRLEELRETLAIVLPEGDYETVGGFLLEKLGRVPVAGESVRAGAYRLEVLQADRRRIEQVAVRSERVRRRAS